MTNETSLETPATVDRFKFIDVPQAGPFIHGNYIPLYGMEMRIIQVKANANMDFVVVLAPQAVTKGTLKRMHGKKGKKGAKGTGKGKRS